MFLKKQIQQSQYVRRSKNGVEHKYTREKTVAIFLCDNCSNEFSRDVRLMDRKRLNNNYFHVCGNCDSKRFAQRKGVEQKKIWDMPASTTLPVGKY
jgi:hypothetical protein